MLVLSRQRDETIMIGDDIEITVVDIRGDKVRLGIDAPSDISVHRKEVYDAIKRENEQAASLDLKDLSSFNVPRPQTKPDPEKKKNSRSSGRSPRRSGLRAAKSSDQDKEKSAKSRKYKTA